MAEEDQNKSSGDTPTAASGPAADTSEPSATTPPPAAPEVANVRIEGLAEALSEASHELHLISHASKFEWINKRLILVRNAVIAFSVIVVVVIISVLCFREAYRQTLTISAFEVPEQLAEHGITGQAVAKALFDELIKRRKTVTTLDAGELKSAWAESHSDVAVPEAGFTMQSAFRYLRSLTGREVAIDGEMLVDGGDITIKARVAGSPPRSVKGKLADWEALLGELADYVFEATQPAVLASYWGLTAQTPDDLGNISRLIVRMATGEPRATSSALSVAYYAYGLALERQNRISEALSVWARARQLDAKFALPYLAAAQALTSREPANSEQLLRQTTSLELNQAARMQALASRYVLANRVFDCARMREVVVEEERIAPDDLFMIELHRAAYMVRCDYQQAKGIAIMRMQAAMHPEYFSATYNPWIALVGAEESRELWPSHLQDAYKASEAAVAAATEQQLGVRVVLARTLANLGEHEAAMKAYQAELMIPRGAESFNALNILPFIYFNNGELKEAEIAVRRVLTNIVTANNPQTYRLFGRILEAQNRTAEAIDTLREGYAVQAMYCPNYDTAAEILLKHGRDAEAFAEWEKGITAAPKCDLTYVHMAQALIERKRIPEAKQKLEALLKISPESDGAEIAKDLLAGMAKTG